MFCTECGQKFNGKFCPNCGAPSAGASELVEYPPAPIGNYKGTLCEVTVGKSSIVIQKKILFTKSVEEIDYINLANISYKKGVLGGFLCIRTSSNISTPLSTSGNSASDPFSADFPSSSADTFFMIYNYLKQIVEINDYPLPEPAVSLPRDEVAKPPICNVSQDPVPLQRESKEKPLTKRQRIQENKKNGVACCPKCGSTSLSASKKGFGLGKAAIGVWAVGIPGAVAGAVGSKKVEVTCLNCGHRWKM